jgi:hypothetical protein
MKHLHRCRYISTYDGVTRCAHEVFAQRFCRFHYEAFLAGEVTAEGYLADTLSDQVRRRQINFHGVHPDQILVGPGSGPLTGDCESGGGGSSTPA